MCELPLTEQVHTIEEIYALPEEKNQTIWIIPGMTAYDDPNEAVG